VHTGNHGELAMRPPKEFREEIIQLVKRRKLDAMA
jgi:hypothetical protein